MIISPWGGGFIKFKISGILTLQMIHTTHVPHLVKIGPVVFREKMLTHEARWTTHNEGSQPIAIGHLSDSDDLIIGIFI